MSYDDDDDLDVSLDRGGDAGNVSNHLVLSVLVTIFCCWPLGIPAIIYAAKVNSLVAQGDYAGARSASRIALTLSIVNAVLTIIGAIGYFFLMLNMGHNGF